MSHEEKKPCKLNLLLIQPRWLTDDLFRTEFESLSQEYPAASFTLLSQSRPDNPRIEFILLPESGRRAVKNLLLTILKVRRRKFREVIIVTEPYRTERGYFESKFWAFVSRANIRRLGRLRTLKFSDEFSPKIGLVARALFSRALEAVIRLRDLLRETKKATDNSRALRRLKLEASAVITHCPVCNTEADANGSTGPTPHHYRCQNCQTIYLCYRVPHKVAENVGLLRHVKEEDNPAQWQRRHRLQAYTYLTWHDKIFHGRRGYYFDINDDTQYLDVAKLGGWEVGSYNKPAERDMSFLQYDFVTAIDVLNHSPDPQRFFLEIKEKLSKDGACLVRTVLADQATLNNAVAVSGLRALCFPGKDAIFALSQQHQLKIIDIKDSLFETNSSEIWLQKKADEDSH